MHRVELDGAEVDLIQKSLDSMYCLVENSRKCQRFNSREIGGRKNRKGIRWGNGGREETRIEKKKENFRKSRKLIKEKMIDR